MAKQVKNLQNTISNTKFYQVSPAGTSRLAKNLLSSIKSFWTVRGCPGIMNDNNIELEHLSVFDSAMRTSINTIQDQLKNRNLKALTNIRLKNRYLLITGQLNTNSIWYKFDFHVPK